MLGGGAILLNFIHLLARVKVEFSVSSKLDAAEAATLKIQERKALLSDPCARTGTCSQLEVVVAAAVAVADLRLCPLRIVSESIIIAMRYTNRSVYIMLLK